MLIRKLTYVVAILLSWSLGGCSIESDAANQPKAADARVRELIALGQIDELDKFLNSVQFAFMGGGVEESVPYAAFAPFATTDPAVNRLARAWLRSHPDSFAAPLAAAIQSDYMGRVSAEAGALADLTGREPQSTSQYFATAARYYMLAITLEPRALPAYTGLISVYTETGQKTALRETSNLTLKRFPLSPHIHKQILVGLTPEYEGSWDKMLTYVQGVGDRTQEGVQPGSKVNRLYDELFHTLELYRARSLFEQKIYRGGSGNLHS